jgi:hypothetical protein
MLTTTDFIFPYLYLQAGEEGYSPSRSACFRMDVLSSQYRPKEGQAESTRQERVEVGQGVIFVWKDS